MGESNGAIEALKKALIEAWEDLLYGLFKQVADSMPYWVAAVIKAKG